MKTTEQGSVDLQNNCVVKTVDSNIASKVDQMAKDGAKVIYKRHVYFHIQNFIGDLLEEEKASVYKPLSWVCTTGRHGRSLLLLLAIKNISSPISLNYHLSICIVIVFLLPVQLKCF